MIISNTREIREGVMKRWNIVVLLTFISALFISGCIVAADTIDDYYVITEDSAGNWSDKGNELLGQGQYQEARYAFDQAIEMSPQYVVPMTGKGITLNFQGHYEEALRIFTKALVIDPTYAQAWWGKGKSLEFLGRYDEALDAYDRAIKIKPGSVEYRIAKGDSLVLNGLYQEAIDSYNLALKMEPNNNLAQQGKATARMKFNSYQRS
ncbi:MAG: tetratricopeptide repeat protein [Methanospirillum sp.]|uniref:tetratricopeptide repeat protein n=1 Tax=Methanospirillum sp. TaxID=45200 RepID=UPI00236BE19C|nr:tetratricopeptide repeat protein [Methanospirillum sp.]MDD1729560.1 tetratricopeptide repeat protein [Methanospirillum sp.]